MKSVLIVENSTNSLTLNESNNNEQFIWHISSIQCVNRTMTLMQNKKQTIANSILAILFWIGLLYIFIYQSPDSFGIFIAFVVLLYLSIFYTGIIFLGKKRYGIYGASIITGFLLLHQYYQLSVLNAVLFIALLLTIELFVRQKRK